MNEIKYHIVIYLNHCNQVNKLVIMIASRLEAIKHFNLYKEPGEELIGITTLTKEEFDAIQKCTLPELEV